MDTSGLESFAQTLRTELLSGVRQRLRYWGFADDGSVEEAPEEVEGGYIFRGEVHGDPGVPKKWRALKNAVSRHDVEHVAEEAAYTWFNRLVAIRILEKNGYVPDTLGYAEETTQPAVLYRAKQKEVFDVVDDEGEQDVREAILESDDDRAFRQLLIGVCHDNDLLNDVFGRLNDFTELLLPTGLLQPEGVIDELVTTDAISDEDYEQVELIGWLYQFYISEKKDEVYDASGKFQPEDIPAATQIFTPRWIVRYMVENTIGKQWLEKYPDSPLRDEMEYLVENGNEDAGAQQNGSTGEGEQVEVFDKEGDGDPTAPIFDDLSELELFDPAAGSGHILVVGFDLLMEMYRERGYTDREAVELVLTENLKGLEIDRRAAQLARFALLMKAAQYDRQALDRDDLRPEVHAMPEPRDFSTSDLRAYLGDDLFDAHGAEVKEALDLIAEHGQNVGSALKLDLSKDARDDVEECVSTWDEKSSKVTARLDEQELHKELRGYLKPLLLLTGNFPAVAMNPPYMGSRRMNTALKHYLKENYPDSNTGKSAAFIEVGLSRLISQGLVAMISQQTWMFLKSYKHLRHKLLTETTFMSMVHLGPDAFDEISGEVVQATTFTLRNCKSGSTGHYYRLVKHSNSLDKRDAFLKNEQFYPNIPQADFQIIPGSPIAYWLSDNFREIFKNDELSESEPVKKGIDTGKNDRFLRMWTEVSSDKMSELDGEKWIIYIKGGKFQKWFGNLEFVVNWENEGKEIKEHSSSTIRNPDFFFRSAVTWSRVSSEGVAARFVPEGCLFDNNGSSVFPDKEHIYISAFLNSSIVQEALPVLNPTLDFQVGDVKRLPYKEDDAKTKAEINRLAENCINIVRDDWSRSELAWDYQSHPLMSVGAQSLKDAYDLWKQKSVGDFTQLHANEEDINELFNNLYGLEDEISPRVALDDVTILEDELDRDALEDLDGERDDLTGEELRQRFLEDDLDEALFKVEVPIRQFLSYGIGVMLGRYRLGHDGLHIAHPNPSSGELAPYEVPVPLSGSESNSIEQFEIDDDAIVPLMGRDSPFSDDAVVRMRDIVRLIWGEETLTENLNFIDRALSTGRGRGYKRNYEQTMEDWLVGVESHRTKIRNFWDWHKDLYGVRHYGKKPIYWLFQSPKEHFQVLVYMHRMDKYTPQRVRQDYLQRYQEWLRREIESLESEGEETLSTDRSKRLDTLREAAADCREYDAILKDVADQQIEIDLDDGVQNNYPKFGDAVADL